MKLLFIDEIEQPNKNKNFFGVGLFIIDSTKYALLLKEFINLLKITGWNHKKEFKGRFLFSGSKGDKSVNIEKRINLVDKMVENTSTGKTIRAKFFLFSNFKKKTRENYLRLISALFNSSLKKETGAGKNLVILFYHRTELVSSDDIFGEIEPVLRKKNLFLVERPCSICLDNKSIGIIYSDVLSYIKSWDVLSLKPDEKQQAELFDLKAGERDVQKLKKIREILSKVKSVEARFVKN